MRAPDYSQRHPAAVVFYYRAALLVTRPTLHLLSAAELQAAVAHEIGHEYFWSEFENARLAGSAATRNTLELKCDGIAALTLLGLRLDVSSLTSAMRKTIEFNEGLRVTTDTMGYPTVSERESFVCSRGIYARSDTMSGHDGRRW